jgi:hypothetical protein
VDHQSVSRQHGSFSFEADSWWFHDLGSTNGTYLQGKRVDRFPIEARTVFNLGKNGPEVIATVQPLRVGPVPQENLADYYLGSSSSMEGAGDRTIFIRRAFQDVRRRHRRRNILVIGVSALLILTTASYALYQRSLANRQRQLAEDLFYSVKSVELEVARAEETLKAFGGPQAEEQIARSRARLAASKAEYEQFLKEIGLYSRQLSEEDRLILRVTQIFGECELGMPPDYVSEVKRFIGYWRSTDRFKNAIAVAEQNKYASKISTKLLDQNLPPQFFYLALQESNFNLKAVGPQTYKGFAKGMWQFIPDTAIEYGLKLGPLKDFARPDPGDDRIDFEKSTDAAARYLKFIYRTDAQASGLLVMASYNWGEGKVVPLIKQLPANPRDRNFWRLLSQYRDKIPQETYNYVFYIVAAATIGENPRLFGFDFESPLKHLEQPSSNG